MCLVMDRADRDLASVILREKDLKKDWRGILCCAYALPACALFWQRRRHSLVRITLGFSHHAHAGT